MNKTILPGALLGIIGGGEHSRMLTLAARQMGYRVAVLSPEADCPAGPFANLAICASLDDVDAVADLARNLRRWLLKPIACPQRRRKWQLDAYRCGRASSDARGKAPRAAKIPPAARLPVLPFVEIGSLRMLQKPCRCSRLQPCSRPPRPATVGTGRSSSIRRCRPKKPGRRLATDVHSGEMDPHPSGVGGDRCQLAVR